MKTTLPLKLAAVLLVAALSACSVSVPSPKSVTGSGDVITITNDSADFDRVVISHAFQASIQQGEVFSVVIRVDDNLEEYLEVTQVGRTLSVGLRPQLTFGISRPTLEAEITMPVLAAIEASGASRVALSGFESQEDLTVDASGASSITGDILAGSATMQASGASNISLVGTGEDIVLEVSGASSADLEEFVVSGVHAVLSGASTAVVNTSGTLAVDASWASHLTYVGNPTLGSVQTSGASSVGER